MRLVAPRLLALACLLAAPVALPAQRDRGRLPLASIRLADGRRLAVHQPARADSTIDLVLDSARTVSEPLFRLRAAAARELAWVIGDLADSWIDTLGTRRVAESDPRTPSVGVLAVRTGPAPRAPVTLVAELPEGATGRELALRDGDARALARALTSAAAAYPADHREYPPVESGRVYRSWEIERSAGPGSGPPSCAPRYPTALRDRGVPGVVEARFIVDADGRIEPESFAVLHSTGAEFTDAVSAAVPCLRFLPSEIRGTRVRVEVRQPFVFNVVR